MFFFFQAEDGIRDKLVTGVQTCALPISLEARSTALLTDKLHISQELHLDGDRAVALARLTPPAGDVERKSPRVIAALSGLRGGGKDFADGVEGFQVSSGVRAGRSADRRLVHDHNFG